MHQRFRLIIGGGFVALAVFLEAVESFKTLRELFPARLAGMISQLDVVVLFCVGILFLWLGKNPHSEGSGAPSLNNTNTNAGNATATSTGNKIEQHFHFDGYPIENLASAIAEKLKEGDTSLVSAKDEADAATSPRLAVTDGFVQLENVELQVQSATLTAGQTVTAQYFYANRGALPVYEVQTWGLMQVLDPLKNSGPHLKAVMRAAAKEGHQKFPGAATLGVQRVAHSFAPLSEPFTQEQIESLGNKSALLFLLIGGVWVDNRGEVHYWAVCQQAEFHQGLTWDHYAWRSL
jgi:hypothetical protein